MAKWQGWIIALLGVWILVVPWLVRVADQVVATRIGVAVALVQIVFGVWAATHEMRIGWERWPYWVTLVTGLWFVVHLFLGEFDEGPYWSLAAPGIGTVFLSFWAMITAPDVDDAPDER